MFNPAIQHPYFDDLDDANIRINDLVAENYKLRELLALSSSSPVTLYADDGELQDSSIQPFIDYRRDSAEEIEAKLRKRALAALQKDAEILSEGTKD